MKTWTMTTVAKLKDGDVFSLDGGDTWHTCATPLWGCVAVYLTGRYVGWGNSLTIRIEAARDQMVHVRGCLVRGARAI